MNEVQTPQVSSNDTTRETLLEQLTFLIDGARSNLMDMKASLAIDGPLLNADTIYTKEQVIKMLRMAHDIGGDAREKSMTINTDSSHTETIEVEVEVEEGGFTYSGEVNIDAESIKEFVSFEGDKISDELVELIISRA